MSCDKLDFLEYHGNMQIIFILILIELKRKIGMNFVTATKAGLKRKIECIPETKFCFEIKPFKGLYMKVFHSNKKEEDQED